jgi:type I restriction enzyme S subunit
MSAVPAGYKQTEVGVIPEDWSPTFLSDACSLYNGRAYGLHEWERSGIPVIRLQNLTGGEDYYYSTLPLAEQKYCDYGDLLYMWSATFGPRIWQGSKAIYHYHIWKVAPKETRANAAFLYYKLLEITDEKKTRATNGGTMLHVTKASMEATRVALPPLPEQRAIAAALSDVDALLAKLDQLIAKKRDLKQAAMQQLLTGQTRLPGFSGAWEVKRLGDVGTCLRGVSYRGDADLSAYDTDSTKRLLRSNNVQDAAVVTTDIQFVNSERVSEKQMLQERDILICMANGSKALVGKAGLFNVIDGYEYTFGAFMGCFRSSSRNANATFIFYLFQTGRYRNYINNLLAGSSINNLTPTSIESLEFSIPPLPEQTAVAAVLSDMDAELATLEARRDKTRALKQGMMQELLTGRIRLV